MNDMTEQLQLAAIISLLSSSALHGPSAGKSAALCLHLDRLLRANNEILDPRLRSALEQILMEWKIASYCPASPDQASLPPHPLHTTRSSLH